MSPVEITVVDGNVLGENEWGTYLFGRDERAHLMDAIEEIIETLIDTEEVMREAHPNGR